MVRRRPAISIPRTLSLVLLYVLLAPACAFAQDTAETPAPVSWRPRPVRQGTVSLGGQMLYGSLFGGNQGDEFNSGLGLGFNLRYRTAPDQAWGLSFEGHNFDAGDTSQVHDRLQIIVTTLDFTMYSGTRTRVPKYLQFGVGLAQTRITDKDGEKEYPGDGGVLKAGAGLEYWANRTLTFELALRYNGVLLRSVMNHDVQVGLGLNFYTSP